MVHVRSFVAGFLATVVFHQLLVLVLATSGVLSAQAYSMEPTWPLGVPQVVSLAFWGGVWGIILWLVVRRWRGAGRWLAAFIFGAVAPTLVAALIVLPLRGVPLTPWLPLFGGLLNGVWGLGTLVFLQLFERLPVRR